MGRLFLFTLFTQPGKPENPEVFQYPFEAGKAYEKGTLADDIRVEQKKLDAADLVIFQAPMTWGYIPAMLKGWFERILTDKYAYDVDVGKMYDTGNMKVDIAKSVVYSPFFSPLTLHVPI